MRMRPTIFRIVAVAGFCWAVFGLLSLLSELKFLIDALNWSVGHVSISLKDILHGLAKWISAVVLGYRDLVRSFFSRVFHIPHLPAVVYDVISITVFSFGRGFWFGLLAAKQSEAAWKRYIDTPDANTRLEILRSFESHPLLLRVSERLLERYGISMLRVASGLGPRSWRTWLLYKFLLPTIFTLVYGAVVALALCLLFSIDYAYRHPV
jgi:hypothetical protein